MVWTHYQLPRHHLHLSWTTCVAVLRYSRKRAGGRQAMGSAGKRTALTEYMLGYPLETCVLFCAVIRKETQVLISVGTPQHISHFTSVANEEETSWQLPEYIWCFVGTLYVVMTQAMTSKYNVCRKRACCKGSLEPGKQQVLFSWLCAVSRGSSNGSSVSFTSFKRHHLSLSSFKPDPGDQALRI